MADAALGVVVETLFNTVVSLAAEEITLAWGVPEELEKLDQKRQKIQALLSDAQSKQWTSALVQDWLKKLGSVALDALIVLDEFGYDVLRQKVPCRKRDQVSRFFSSSNPVVHRSRIARKIKDVMSSIERVCAESNEIGLREVINSPPRHLKENRSTDPFVDGSKIVGRDDDSSKVINMLIGSDYEIALPVITILGMGGQGKTTLAQLVYKDDKVQSYFDKRVWVCVSDDFKIENLLAEMLQCLTGTNHQLTNAEALVGKLKEILSGKRYLFVLDDVWNENVLEWDRMRGCLQEICGSKGSKVLATTRNELVARTMHTSQCHGLEGLSDEQSWKLFEKWAFADGGAIKSPKLVGIGKSILKRCGGVPLAIRVIGGLLNKKNCESEWSMIERSKLWSDLDDGKGVSSVGPSSSVPNVHCLPSLRHVGFIDCDKFIAPFCCLKILAPLKCLEISCKPSLWPKDLHHLTNLRSLKLGGSDDVEEVDCFPFPYSISSVNVTEMSNIFPLSRLLHCGEKDFQMSRISLVKFSI